MSLLDSRLQAVLSLVPQGSVLLDIGTDHCKLPAEGLLSGKLAVAYAADIRKGPLAAAEKQLNSLGLQQRVPLFLSDGLKDVPLDVLQKVDVTVVAGMGGELIELIMDQAPLEPPLWVLQPMSAVYELLDALAAKGYAVKQAALSKDGDKIYRIFAVQKEDTPYSPDYFSIHHGDPLYTDYLLKEEKRMEIALNGLRSAKSPDEKRIEAAEALLTSIRKAMQ